MNDPQQFYDDLAADYEKIFADWPASVRWQGELLAGLLNSVPHRVLDLSCGIGTQAIGLALQGFDVLARDLSPNALQKARDNARRFAVDLELQVGDMRDRRDEDRQQFDSVLSFDNSLPHLTEDHDLHAALRAACQALRPGGTFLASIRDYDQLLQDRPRLDPPRVFGSTEEPRIVLQHWTWLDERRYCFEHMILSKQAQGEWSVRVRKAHYRARRRSELTELAEQAGLRQCEWLMPEASGFYQPVLRAQAP